MHAPISCESRVAALDAASPEEQIKRIYLLQIKRTYVYARKQLLRQHVT